MGDFYVSPLPPDTTSEEDKLTSFQRKFNGVWEYTQAALVLGISFVFVFCAVKGIDSRALDAAFFVVVGLYSGRRWQQEPEVLKVEQLK